MATTPGGMPYPEPSDPLRDGAPAIRALAEALGPTEPTSHKLAAGFTGFITSQQVGPLVVVSVDASGTIASNSTPDLGSGVTPAPDPMAFGICYLGNGYPAAGLVRPDGTVAVGNRSGAQSNRARFTVIYPAPTT